MMDCAVNAQPQPTHTSITMSNTEILDLRIADITIPADRARGYNENNAQALAALILAQGLFHPIRVRHDGTGYRLISGLHRLRAHEINGAETIPATVSHAATDEDARLEEVMENLGRAELIALDRCQHLYELKVAWLAAHPEAAAGGDRKSIKAQTLRFDPDGQQIIGLAASVAEHIGLGVRTIEGAVKIWTGLTADAVMRLPGTDLARKQTELKALSEHRPVTQAKILDLILGDEHPDIQNVAGAVAFLEGGVVESPAEKQFRSINTAFGKLADDALDMIVQNNADRMIASLKRLGRL